MAMGHYPYFVSRRNSSLPDKTKSRRNVCNLIEEKWHVHFTRSERDVLLEMVNLWFDCVNDAVPVISPGREILALAVECSTRTVARTLSILRGHGIITAVAYPNGGTIATSYTVDVDAIFALMAGASA